MVDITIGKLLRGIIVTTCSSVIIYFLVVILSPILPFISLDNFMALILLITIYFLTIVTYFLLPSEISETNYAEKTENILQMETQPET